MQPPVPDPRVLVALRAAGLKRQFERPWHGVFGRCIPTFQMNTPYTDAEKQQVADANACLDGVVTRAEAAGDRLPPTVIPAGTP